MRSIARYIALGSLLVSTATSYALSYPVTTPTGETTGGTYRMYFDNIFSSETLCDGVHKVVGGFNNIGQPICVTPVANGFFLTGQTLGDTIRFNGTDWVRNNLLYNNGSAIGIANQTPAYLLDVSGTANFLGIRFPTGAASGYVLTSDSSGVARWSNTPSISLSGVTGGTQYVVPKFGLGGVGLILSSIYDNGTTVGINTLAPSASYKFDVVGGDARINGIRVGAGGGNLSSNVAIGLSALGANVTSPNNVVIGNLAGSTLTAGAGGNILIGNGVNTTTSTSVSELNIGNWIYGNVGNIGIGYAGPFYSKFNVNGDIEAGVLTGAAGRVKIGGAGSSGKIDIFEESWTPNRDLNINFWQYVTSGALNIKANIGYTAQSLNPGSEKTDMYFQTMVNGVLTKNLYIGSGGYIGIGTINPGAKLEVNGQIKITGGSPGAGRYLQSDASGLAIWTGVTATNISATGITGGTEYYLPKFGIGGNGLYPSILYETGGKIGLNTNAPSVQFDVNGTIRIRSGATNNYVLTSDANGVASWQSAPASMNSWNIVGNAGTVAGTNFLGTTDAQSLVIKTNNLERIRIDTSGNVGIGTSSAGQRLTVSGGTLQIINGSQGAGRMLISDANGIASWTGVVTATNLNLAGAVTGSTIYYNSGTWMVGTGLFNNGTNIGIGTASPTKKLTLDSGLANDSGMRLVRLISTSPVFTGVAAPLGVDGSGNVVVAQQGAIPVYTALGATPNAVADNTTNPPTIGANYDKYFTINSRQSFTVTDVGGNPYNCPEFQTGSTNKGPTGCSQTPWATYVMTAQNATSGNRYAYQILISDRTDAPFVVRGGMYSSGCGTLMNTAMTIPALWFKAITVPTNRSDWFYINPGVDQNNNVIAGGGNVGIGTMSPTANLDVVGSVRLRNGSPGVGKFLTSDALGNASWTGVVTATSLNLAGATTGATIYYNSGTWNVGTGLYNNGRNIGIGTSVGLTDVLTIDSGIGDDSGLRLSRINPNSPLTANGVVALGINSSGKVLPISPISNIAVYNGVLRNAVLVPNPDLNNFNITYDFNQFFAIPGKQSFVVSQGNGPSNNGPYFKENGTSSLCSLTSTGTSPYDCNDNDPATGLSASPWNSFTMSAKGDTFGYQIALGARGDAPLFARSGRFNGAQTGGLFTNDSPYNTPAPWNKVMTVPANHPEYLYINTGLNSQLQAQAGAGNVGIGTTFPQSRFEVWSGATSDTIIHFRGNGNVGLGISALNYAASGSWNTAVGAKALDNIIQGSGNTALGFSAGANITTGSNNIMIGSGANAANPAGSNQLNIGNWIYGSGGYIGIGISIPQSQFEIWSAGQVQYHSRGFNNLGVGSGALSISTTGNSNVAIGPDALFSNAGGYSNTAVGYKSMRTNGAGYNNTAVGQEALFNGNGASWNAGVGYQALYSNSSGTGNTALGARSLYNLSTGNANTALGYEALRVVAGSSVGGNTAVGFQSLPSTTSSNSTAVGFKSLFSNTSGAGNTAFGYQSLYSVNTSSNNTAFGYNTLSTTTGHNNVAIGYNAGSNLAAGSGNILIGNGVQTTTTSSSNELNIGNWIYGSAGNIGVGTSTGTARLSVAGQIQILGGNPGLGKVLVSDANGLASWGSVTGSALTVWNLGGNTGTVAGTNFLGTTDLVDLSLKTNNSERVRIGSNGNVGIGITSTGSRLDINGNLYLRGSQTLTPNQSINFSSPGIGSSNPGGFRWLLATDSATMYSMENAADNTDFVFKLDDNATDGGDRFLFWQTSWSGLANHRWPLVMNGLYAVFDPRFTNNTATGTMQDGTMYLDYTNRNVGIFTNAPTASTKLDVNGTIRIRGGNPGVGKVLVSDANGIASWQPAATGSIAGWSLIGNAGTDPVTNFLGTTDAQALVLRTNNTEKLRITTGGYVGIGTNNPQSMLHINGGDIKLNDVAGQSQFTIKSYSSASSLWFMGAAGSSIILSDAHDWDRGVAFTYAAGTSGLTGGVLTIGQVSKNTTNYTHGITRFYTAGNERLRIAENGTVGIGTTAPSSSVKLDVNGQVKISGGSPSAGKVLTSDATGIASWQSVVATLTGGTANYVTRWLSASSVGIGSFTDNGAGTITFPTANSRISGNQGLVIEETGDTYGTARLYLQNRAGVNGLMLEQAGSVDLTDLVFKGLTNQRNIRYEARGGANNFAGTPEFQIGQAGNPTVAIGDSKTIFRLGNVGIGVDPTQNLDVGGTIRIRGNAGSGKILVSDASGVGNWMTPSSSQTGTFIYRVTTTQSSTSNFASNATEMMSASLPTGPYEIIVYARYQSASTSVGIGLTVTGTTAQLSDFVLGSSLQETASTRYQGGTTIPGTLLTSSVTPAASTTTFGKLEGTFNVTGAGTVGVQFASEVGGTQVSLMPGSVMIIRSLNPSLYTGGSGI